MHLILPSLLLLAGAGLGALAQAADAPAPAAPPTAKIVCIGASITDGHTYPLLTAQALRAAGRPVPQFVNAGIGGDTAKGVRARLERDVLVHHPTMVLLLVGTNDIARQVPVAEYEADIAAVAARLQEARIALIVLTITPVDEPLAAERAPQIARFNTALRRVAAQYGARLAEVHDQLAAPPTDGLFEPDHVHLAFAGYRRLVRVVLDALGHTDVAVPEQQELAVMPGIIPTWQLRPVGDKEAKLDEQTVAAMVPDATWRTLTLPQAQPVPKWWLHQERQRGFAVALPDTFGPAPHGWLAVATIPADAPRPCFLNPGAEVRTIWLNGQKLFTNDAFRGWHAGFVRLPIELRPGANIIVMETGNSFFLSVTDTDTW